MVAENTLLLLQYIKNHSGMSEGEVRGSLGVGRSLSSLSCSLCAFSLRSPGLTNTCLIHLVEQGRIGRMVSLTAAVVS